MTATADRQTTPQERNETLIRLVGEYRCQGAQSEAAHTLFHSFLPELIRPLRFDFPGVDDADFLSLAWEVLRKGGFERSESPCAWVLSGIRESLRRRLLAERHGVSESIIRDGKWKKIKQTLKIQADEVFVRSVGEHEETVLRSLSSPSAGVCEVWNELESLLRHLAWPASLAAAAVEILDSHADTHGFHSKAVSRELAKYLPANLREALIAFVTVPRGYVWARLHNVSAAHAISLPAVRAQLVALRYQTSP
ncbi:hypothetical protein AL755_03670 (plasmid) [Arthrobacter sp. ERGS1:01]|nr:hypothetical protein AL755_03670 [Arthrobacter sp. ERGS1:01]